MTDSHPSSPSPAVEGPGCFTVATIVAGTKHANELPVPPKGRKIERIWTVIDREKLAEIGPMHNVSAFLEDHVHDWRLDRDGKLHYYSRVVETDKSVEVVFDFETMKERDLRLKAQAAHYRPRPR